MGDGSRQAVKIRPTWLQFAPFVGGAVLLALSDTFLPSTVVSGPSYEINLTWSSMYLAFAAVILVVASYLGARWSGRARPDLVAIVAAAAGTMVLVYPGIGGRGLWLVVAATIAVRPPSPIAYPARLGIGVLLVYAVPWVIPISVVAMAAPLFGVWLADRVIDRAISGRGTRPAGVRAMAAGAALGVVSGAVIGVVLGIAAVVTFAAVASIVSSPDPSGATSGDVDLALFGVALRAGVVGAGLGLFTGPFLAKSRRKKLTASRS
ncbi:MAG: hypothetical protein BMS9Abin07_1831 [Acidimicrobiia bacterium]|nr:MAG: hypothetical protein BMS9Abin07_1831 [Acidimicrobiia bacterium]